MKLSNSSFLWDAEKWVTGKLCKITPRFLGTKALTFLSLGSSALIFASYYLAARKSIFLFAASFFVLMQWMFDCLDGAIGRLRQEGFVRWGFYMDHLFDYFFMASIVFGLWFLFPQSSFQIMVLFLLFGSFMVSFFLLYSAVKDKEPDLAVSFGWFSPIEFRLLVILFNTLLYFFEGSVRGFVEGRLFYFNIFLLAVLAVVIYVCQKKLHRYDVGK